MRVAAVIIPFGALCVLVVSFTGQMGIMLAIAAMTMAISLLFGLIEAVARPRPHKHQQAPNVNVLIVEREEQHATKGLLSEAKK